MLLQKLQIAVKGECLYRRESYKTFYWKESFEGSRYGGAIVWKNRN